MQYNNYMNTVGLYIPRRRFYNKTEKEELELIQSIAFCFLPGSIVAVPEKNKLNERSIYSCLNFYTTDTGYKYQIGTGNDYKIDEVEKYKIYKIVSRYDNYHNLFKIAEVIALQLDLHVLYYDIFENELICKIFEHITGTISPSEVKKQSSEEVFEIVMDNYYRESREMISKALIELRVYPSELFLEKERQKVIDHIYTDLCIKELSKFL